MGNDPLPTAVSDAGPLIHLAQVSKLNLLKKVFKRVLITPRVKREVVNEGIRLGHADALVARKAIEEGWIVIEDVPEAMALTVKRLAEDENLSRTDTETLLLAKESGAEILVDEKGLSDLAKMYGLKVWNTWTILLEALRFIEVSNIESAIIEFGEKRHKLNTKQVTEILEAAKLIDSRRKLTKEEQTIKDEAKVIVKRIEQDEEGRQPPFSLSLHFYKRSARKPTCFSRGRMA